MSQPVHIIGIGDDGMAGVASSALERIRQAEILIGPEKTLRQVADSSAQRLIVGTDFAEMEAVIAEHPDRRIVVLAGGDPLFYGMARYLWDRFGKDRFEVVPHVSTMQLAFARVKESWDDAYLADLSSRPLERIIERVRSSAKAGLFTTEQVTPQDVAQALLDRGLDYFTCYVCENLGAPDERVTAAGLEEIARQKFSVLNVMILIRKPEVPDRPLDMQGRRLFGNPDEAFLQNQPKRALLTPAEIRSWALAELDLGPSSLVWDVGAGSGSVAIEAAQIAHHGRVFAIEMDPDDVELIQANARRFGVDNLRPILGQAPAAWEDLPDPDGIFIGGTGRQVREIAGLAWDRLRSGGRLVVHVSSPENVSQLASLLSDRQADVRTWMINLARGTEQFEQLRFEALNPSFLVSATKPA